MKKNITLLFLLIYSVYAFANSNPAPKPFWGQTGHRVVGKIADTYLKGSTKRKIKILLNSESLAFVSTFADEIKSDRRYDKFKAWHYVNMPFDTNYENSKKNSEGSLVTGIDFCITTIKDKNASNDDKAFYLRLLIHLIGDLHQPMHIGREEDRGGNDIKLQWKYKDSNLHRVWDTQIIDSYGMSYSELAANSPALSKTQVNTIKKGSVVDWVNETHQLTKKIYASVEAGDNLRYRYSYDYLKTVRSQLQIGGIRLAKVLNDLF